MGNEVEGCSVSGLCWSDKVGEPGNFMELCIQGILTADSLDDYVERWHSGEGAGMELHEYLGMTWNEYGSIVENSKNLKMLIIRSKLRNEFIKRGKCDSNRDAEDCGFMNEPSMFDKYLSCFSPHEVEFEGVEYKTAEHAYHAQRYADESIRSQIMEAETPQEAWAISQRYKVQQLPDWDQDKLKVMKDILYYKMIQNPDVYRALAGSKSRKLVKHCKEDAFWGDGPEGEGLNHLGKLWMELRWEET